MVVAGEAKSAKVETIIADKSQMDTDDDKVNSNKKKYIHDDLSLYILSKLPIKSLKRFGCVRKSWSLLFENTHFTTMYRNHFNDDSHHHTYLFMHVREMDADRYHAQLHLFQPPDDKNTLKLINLPPPFHEDDNYLQIVCSTSVNGILCLKQTALHGNVPDKVRFVLWNPATHEFLVVPPSPDESQPQQPYMYGNDYVFHGFGYDKVRDDFKVFQYVRFEVRDIDLLYKWPPISRDTYFEIYSPRTNSWRIVDIDMPYSFIFTAHEGGHGVYLDGMCHWLVMEMRCNGEKFLLSLLSFILSDEVFFVTPMDHEKHFFEEPPMDERSDQSFWTRYHLVVLNESIAVITNHDTTLQISILGEPGVKESWIKLFNIDLTHSFNWGPIGVGKKGCIFFRKKDSELAWLDLRTQQIEEIGVKAQSCCEIGIYKESVLPIRGLNN